MWLFIAGIMWILAGFTPAIGFAGAAVLSHATLVRIAGALGYVAYLGSMFGLVHAWNRWWLERRGHLQADDRGLWLDEKLIVARDAVRHGHLLRRDGFVYVRLGRMLRLIEVRVANDDEGEALLEAMRLDPARSVGHYPMNYGTYRSSWLRAGVFLGLTIAGLGVVAVARRMDLFLSSFFVWAVVSGAWVANTFVRVAVGADGVRVRRLLSRSRFIRFGAIESAESDGRDVALQLRNGTVIAMHHPAGKKSWMPHVLRDRLDDGRMLVDRINAQIEHHKHASGDLRGLARAGRGTREWLREVAFASDDHGSFRVPAVPPEALWRVVEDPAAPSSARAGAALALRAGLDEEGRARLCVIADACAASKLRVALEVAASTAEAEALEEAFEDIQDDEQAAAERRV